MKRILLFFAVAYVVTSCCEIDGGDFLRTLLESKCRYDCGASIRMGEFNISEEARSALQYQPTDTAIFVNNKQEELDMEIVITGNEAIYQSEMVTKYLCNACDGKDQKEYYEVEKARLSFRTIDESPFYAIISMTVNIEAVRNINIGEELYYENFDITANLNDSIFVRDFTIIPAVHEVAGTVPPDFITQNESYFFYEDINLLDRNFQQVYTDTTEPPNVYFSFSEGLIAFTVNGDLWVFDRLK